MIGYYNYTVVATYFGLGAAVCGILFALTGNPLAAVYCLMIAGVTDMFDGKIARTRERTENEKRFGIQIDSLTDLVCFGVLPAAITCSVWCTSTGKTIPPLVAVAAAIYVLAALIRLAYFNVVEEERQQTTNEKRKEFEGVPVTTVALILPLFFGLSKLMGDKFPIVLTGVLVLTAFAFVSKVRVRKPGNVGIIIMSVVGIAEAVLLIFGSKLF